MKEAQRKTLVARLETLKYELMKDDIEIVYRGETKLNKEIGGYLTEAYIDRIISSIELIK